MHVNRTIILAFAALAAAGCGSATAVQARFEGFAPVAGGLFVVRWTDANGSEIAGSRQSQGVPAAGVLQFQFNLPTGTPLRLQYFIDQNDNRLWDGPVTTGEPSWDRDISLPPPVHNRDSITLTVGYQTQFAAVPADFKAP
jgi:hypothetical protein